MRTEELLKPLIVEQASCLFNTGFFGDIY